MAKPSRSSQTFAMPSVVLVITNGHVHLSHLCHGQITNAGGVGDLKTWKIARDCSIGVFSLDVKHGNKKNFFKTADNDKILEKNFTVGLAAVYR